LGIDKHGLNFARYAVRKKPLGKVATIGRQALAVPALREKHGIFCEEFLISHLGATEVHSYDNSPYEGASHIADFNQPIVPSTQYDTVLDFGTTEHIYSITQALDNIRLLCAEGGQILHVSPANNFCGHGFWQFSPELFFSLYSEQNGYSETEVFLADLTDTRHWFAVIRPSNGERAQATSRSPVYVLCRTVKRRTVSRREVQQSDYVSAWSRTAPVPTRLKTWVKSSPFRHRIALSLLEFRQTRRERTGLSRWNPHFTRVSVAALLKS
jgi:hypothetical protein